MKTLLKHQGLHFAAALLLCIAVTGCGKKNKPLPITDAQPYEDTLGGPDSLSDIGSLDGWGEPDPVLTAQARAVYFGYDSTQVAGSEYSKLQNVVTLLRQNPSHKLKIEGHCDERGSREYNLALGERRALAVRSFLLGEGISGDRIQPLSLGEEQPADMGHNEAAWRMNRRAEFRFYK